MLGYEVYNDLPDDSEDRGARLDRAYDLLAFLDSDTPVAFTALQDAMVLLISGMCPVCRKQMAKVLRRRVPVMVARAGEMAALHPEKEHVH